MNEASNLVKASHYSNRILIANGWEGSGKSGIASIIQAHPRVELLRYCYEVEWICSMVRLGEINGKSAALFIKTYADLCLYDLSIGRNINLRRSDLSSAINHPNWIEYARRILFSGITGLDAELDEGSIMQFTTHNLFTSADFLHESLLDRLIFVETIQDPLYALGQAFWNEKNLSLTSSPKYFTLLIAGTGIPGAYGTQHPNDNVITDWDCAFNKLEMRYRHYFDTLSQSYLSLRPWFVPIFFENFVMSPGRDLARFESLLGTGFNKRILKRRMKRSNIPRKRRFEAPQNKSHLRVGAVFGDSRGLDDDRDVFYKSLNQSGAPKSIISSLFGLSDEYRAWKETILDFILDN